MPAVVLGLFALLLAAGVPAEAIVLPGVLALVLAVVAFVPAEVHSARNERRTGGDRRRRR
jgi:hypothetical protein